jgi:general secretion pathway protein G
MADPQKIERLLRVVFFTLLGIALVAILGVVYITWVVDVGHLRAGTSALLRSIDQACEAYLHDWETYPLGDETILVRSLTTETRRAGRPSLGPCISLDDDNLNRKKTLVADGWGNAIRYRCPGERFHGRFDLWSPGPDGEYDTDDDLCNWED